MGLALDELINDLGIKSRLRECDAIECWEIVVGEHIAKMAMVTRISKGILYVKVNTSTLRNELVLRKRELITKLNTKVGECVVKDIKFQ